MLVDRGSFGRSSHVAAASRIHRSLGVHISFVRSIAMDSWTQKQLSLMKTGGNRKCAEYLKAKGVPASASIKAKYEHPAAQLYKEVLKARVEGRPEPTQLPKPATRSAPPSLGKPGEDPNGMERLSGETDQQYIARQTRLRSEAKARMAQKFGNSGMSSGRMAGIGSDPNYNPNSAYGGGASDLNIDSLVSGFGSALSTIGTAARGAAQSASAAIQDEQTQQSLRNMSSSVATTGASLWSSFSTSVQSVAATVSQPDGADGLSDLQRQMSAQRPATGSKYQGFGSSSMSNTGSSYGAGASAPSSTLQEAQGLPGEDRNGIERLTGESDEQYVMRQTRLRDEAKARMAAKFGNGGLSSASSGAAPSSSFGFASPKPAAPRPAAAMPAAPKPTIAQLPTRQTQSAPSSGNWTAGGGTVTASKNLNATKMKVTSTDDFFSSFGA